MRALDLTVSPGPHCHSGARLTGASYDFLLALLPAAVMGIYFYGFDALRVICASVASAMIAEALMQKILKRPVTIADGSAVVSGFLLALILPANVPLYIIAVANFTGIVIGKQCFGGLGSSPLNPALVGWATMRITKPWAGFLDFDLMLINYDTGFILQYPLAALKAKGPSAISHFDLMDLFFGRQTGGIGASAIIMLLLGGIYLILRNSIRWEIPLSFLVGVLIASLIFWLGNKANYANPFFHILTGNVMMGAFFLSTHNSSSPVNRWGMVVFGLACGTITVLLRAWSVYPDGVVFACLLMSLFVPLLDKLKKRPASAPVIPPAERMTS
ncbi:MAG: RnfABCDGE type electron transport complex subunit D [Thermodesulfobacteriota bacterium]|nr:RnfABCDGE type electron transport complex subunit D [Thermodesulfobacteriota bacterium]